MAAERTKIVQRNCCRMDDLKYMLDKEDIIAEVWFGGTVTVAYNQLITLRCHNYDLTDFPFDEQSCSSR